MKNHDLEYEIDIANNLIRFYISNQSPLYFGQIVLDEAALYKSQFIVRGSENIDMQGDWIAIRQLFNGDELGRITWQFEFQKEFEEQLQ